MAVVQSLIAELLETGRFSSKLSARAMQAHLLEESIRPALERRSLGKQARSGDQRRIPVRGLWLIWARVGDIYIEHCKKGNLSSESIDHSLLPKAGSGSIDRSSTSRQPNNSCSSSGAAPAGGSRPDGRHNKVL